MQKYLKTNVHACNWCDVTVLCTELFRGLRVCMYEVHDMTTRYDARILLSHLSVYFASEGMCADLGEKGQGMYTRKYAKNYSHLPFPKASSSGL